MSRITIDGKDTFQLLREKLNLMFEELYDSIQIIKLSQLENDVDFITISDIPNSFNIDAVSGLETKFNEIQNLISITDFKSNEVRSDVVDKLNEFQILLSSINSSIVSQNNLISNLNKRILDIENKIND